MQTSILRPVCAWCFLLCSVLLLTALPAVPVRAANLGPVIWGFQKLDIRDFEQPFTKIAAGGQHNVAVRLDGTVVAWGWDVDGQATVPPGLSGVIDVAAGMYHTAALKDDGSVVAWGANSFGQTTLPPGLSGVTAIASGSYHTVALKNDGTVVTSGTNGGSWGTPPADLNDVTAVAAGSYHTVALKRDGTVVAWGDNHDGQSTVPAGLSGVVAIAAAGFHTVALKNDGTVVAWGYNYFGQTTVPAGLSGVVAISAGLAYTVALKNDGTVVVFGDKNGPYMSIPPGLNGITSIAAGQGHVLALKSDGTVTAWGDNAAGQAVTLGELRRVKAIDGGTSHIAVLKDDGTVMNWGWTGEDSTTMPAGLSGVVAISSGGHTITALKSDGTVEAWGDSSYGQNTVPAGLSGVVAVAGGGGHTLALKSDGTVVAWGANSYGQRLVPAGLNGVVAIAAGGNHSVALKDDGTVVAWGNNYYGQSTVPAGLSDVVAIAADFGRTLALKNDGTVVVWGDNATSGEATGPAGLSGVVAIAAKGGHTVALKKDGTVATWVWDGDGYVEMMAPAGLGVVEAFATGEGHSMVLISLPDKPVVTTGVASSISANGAALSGLAFTYNTPAVVAFQYGTTPACDTTVAAFPASVSEGVGTAVNVTLSGLQPRMTYYYRVMATNGQGSAFGETRTFTTLNTMPEASADVVTATSGRATTLGVLANDADEDGDTLTIIAVSSAQHGVLTVRGGALQYTPDPGFSGEDTFTYTIGDGFGGTATAVVIVSVPARPQNPVATLLSAKDQLVPGAGQEGSGTEALPDGSLWATFGTPAINNAGQLAFAATVRAGKVTHAGIFTYDAQGERYALVAKKGDAVPELQGPVFATLKDPVLDQAGRVAFLATLSGPGTTKTSNEGIFTTAYGELQMLARKGDQPPDAPAGAKWTAFLSLALPDGVAGPLFIAKMAGARSTGISAANDVGLWGADSNGNVRLLLREGQEVNGRKLKSFVTLSTVPSVSGQTRSFNEAGEVVVRAHFTDGSQGLVTVQVP